MNDYKLSLRPRTRIILNELESVLGNCTFVHQMKYSEHVQLHYLMFLYVLMRALQGTRWRFHRVKMLMTVMVLIMVVGGKNLISFYMIFTRIFVLLSGVLLVYENALWIVLSWK